MDFKSIGVVYFFLTFSFQRPRMEMADMCNKGKHGTLAIKFPNNFRKYLNQKSLTKRIVRLF